MKNISFLFGNDDFSIQELLSAEKGSMREKNPNADIGDFDFAFAPSRFELEGSVRNSLRSGSLFASEKMTIIRNFWAGKKPSKEKDGADAETGKSDNKSDLEDFLLEYMAGIGPNDKIFFVEPKNIDKRSRAFKFFEGLKGDPRFVSREFVLPIGFQLNAWLEERIRKSQGKISKANVELLAIMLGKGMEQRERGGEVVAAYDLHLAALEIDKLIAYADGREISKEDIGLLVSGREDMNIFNLIESLGRRDKARALAILTGQIREGFNENYILTMLVYHFRNLLSIKALANQGMDAGEIASRTRIHPRVVEKSLGYARNLQEENLVLIYGKLASADSSIKTGKMGPELALDLLVAAI